MKSLFKHNKFEIIAISLFSISYVVFCNYLMIELPNQTWFDQFHLVENYYNKTLTYSDFMNTYGEHGLFGYNVLFLINLIVFKLTTFFDVYINDISVIIIGVSCVCAAKKTFSDLNRKYYMLCVILICIFEFNFMQLSSGAMETQVRLGILFFVIAAVMIDKIFIEDASLRWLICTIIFIFLSINIFGTTYSFSGIPVIFLIIIISAIINKKIDKFQISISFAYILSVGLYFLQYRLIGKGNMESGSIMVAIVGIITDPLSALKSLIAYNASTLLGFPVFIDKLLPDSVYLMTGILVTIIYIYSLICFFKSYMYKKTMLPVMLMGYSFFVFLLVLVGRYPNEWDWFVNAWYTVHTKLAAIGCLWILIYSSTAKMNNYSKIIIKVGIAFLVIGIAAGICAELRRVPYERAYYLAKQPFLFVNSIDELPVENGLTPLLASPEVTMNSINLMKEYHLSVYKNYDTFDDMLPFKGEVGSTLKTAVKISGYYDDGWIEKSADLKIKTGEEGKLVFNGYYPKDITGKETGTIYINDQAYPFTIMEANFTIELPANTNSIVNVKIVNDFSFQADPPDVRTLSFVLMDLTGK